MRWRFHQFRVRILEKQAAVRSRSYNVRHAVCSAIYVYCMYKFSSINVRACVSWVFSSSLAFEVLAMSAELYFSVQNYMYGTN